MSHAVASLEDAPVGAPRDVRELERGEFRGELRILASSRLFWAGLVVKVACACTLGSHFATRWFAPFVYQFVHQHFQNPWAAFMAQGEPLAFPYGPGMLAALAPAFAPALVASFDPSSPLGLFLLRTPLLVADVTVCVLLMRWLRVNARDAIAVYWWSPVVLYASYVHGQLDLVPTAMLCISLQLVFARRIGWAGIVYGIGLATKLHLLIAGPFLAVLLWRQRKNWMRFVAVSCGVALLLYAPLLGSDAFRRMVFGSAEARKVWSVSVAYGGAGLVLYLAPAAILIALLRFANYRKVNRELALMFLGAVYVGIVALVPPQPGWFIWSLPFICYLAARFVRIGKFALGTLSAAYMLYFFLGDPHVFLESLNPLLGKGAGEVMTAGMLARFPGAFSTHGASVAWTLLFSCTALAAVEMYRKGVRSNAIYGFRDESFMIGIAGDSGAGKHTIANDLAELMGPQLSLLHGDDDHKWERGHSMWQRYTHLDPRGNRLREQRDSLHALRQGREVHKRHYDHDRGRFTSRLRIRPNDFMAMVGLHPFYLPSQRELLHLRVFIDPLEEVRRAWKINRDVANRGYTPQQVLEQIEKRMADSTKYVRPQAKFADVVIRHGIKQGTTETAVDVELELSSDLDALALYEALEAEANIEVNWSPDDDLNRDRLCVRGTLSSERIAEISQALIPSVDELVDAPAWYPGGRGVAQLTLVHTIGVRLRHNQGNS